MWKKLKTSNYFIQFTNEYEIYVTDYVTIWYAYFSKTCFLRCLKNSNILLQMSDEALLQKGLQVLSNPSSLKSFDTKLEGTCLAINMTMLFRYPFKINMKLCQGSNELFFCNLTQPLLKTVMELKNSQTELCQLLKKKDSEIEEYKCEGGEIALKHLKTKPFNEAAVLSKYMSFQEHFGSTNELLCDLIQTDLKTPENNVKKETLDVSSETEMAKVKMELRSQNWTVKVEPTSQNVTTKAEPDLQNMTFKVEPTSHTSDSQIVTSACATINLKQESGVPIKRETKSLSLVRKKMKKLF